MFSFLILGFSVYKHAQHAFFKSKIQTNATVKIVLLHPCYSCCEVLNSDIKTLIKKTKK